MIEATVARVKVRVTGLVQGVYYRASARERAVALGLRGWVRNTPDGAVELEAQGPDAAVAELITWCHEGPPAARVSHVEVRSLPPVHDAEPQFAILR